MTAPRVEQVGAGEDTGEDIVEDAVENSVEDAIEDVGEDVVDDAVEFKPGQIPKGLWQPASQYNCESPQ